LQGSPASPERWNRQRSIQEVADMAEPRVLLVDDEPSLGVIVSSLGRRGGYVADCRLDAASAWEYLQESAPDLLILDVQLPGESGVALCRRIRATPRLACLSVALFTHWGLSEAIAAGLEAGVDYLIAKDLVGHPARWQIRLGEILPEAHGQPRRRLVEWAGVGPHPSSPQAAPWFVLLAKAMRHPPLRDAGPEVLRILLRRALTAASPTFSEAMIASDGRSLLPGGLPSDPPPETLRRLVGSLADQVWRLLGAEAASPFWEALAEVVPGAPRFARP
jgi:CheY-like chemotaxis protein